jgi:AcrR family transcriptional regulator
MSPTPRSKGKRGRPADPSLRARRQDEILAVAARLFAERGYGAMSLDLLARRVGIGKGTIFRYFRGKRQLFRLTVMREMEALGAAADRRVGAVNEGIDYLRQRLVAFLRELGRRPHLVELLVIERAEARQARAKPVFFLYRERQLPRWRAVLRKLRAEGRIRDLDPDLVGAAVAALAYGAALSHPFMAGGRLLKTHAGALADIVFEGMRR